MDANEYQQLAARTINPDLDRNGNLNNAALGLAGEAGEIADHIKKYLFHGHALDSQSIMLELGDLCWYVCQTATALNIPFDIILGANIDKLMVRYPNGFNSHDSIFREE